MTSPTPRGVRKRRSRTAVSSCPSTVSKEMNVTPADLTAALRGRGLRVRVDPGERLVVSPAQPKPLDVAALDAVLVIDPAGQPRWYVGPDREGSVIDAGTADQAAELIIDIVSLTGRAWTAVNEGSR